MKYFELQFNDLKVIYYFKLNCFNFRHAIQINIKNDKVTILFNF